jgi:predicted alpha/beta hydrolase family esterase
MQQRSIVTLPADRDARVRSGNELACRRCDLQYSATSVGKIRLALQFLLDPLVLRLHTGSRELGGKHMGVKHQLLFVQGGGKGTHDEWDNKLVASLQQELGPEYEIHYPRMPGEEDPSYALWSAALEKSLETLQDNGILVGHSVGATILVKLLSEQTAARALGAIFLIAAPFVGDGGWSADALQFPRDLGARLPKGIPIHFFHGLNDETASHVELYARAVPQARVHRLPDRDHQLNNDLREVAAEILSLEPSRASTVG